MVRGFALMMQLAWGLSGPGPLSECKYLKIVLLLIIASLLKGKESHPSSRLKVARLKVPRANTLPTRRSRSRERPRRPRGAARIGERVCARAVRREHGTSRAHAGAETHSVRKGNTRGGGSLEPTSHLIQRDSVFFWKNLK